MMTPPDTQDPLDSVNAILCANIRQQKLLTESLRQPLALQKPKKLIQRTICYFIFEFFRGSKAKDINNFLVKKDAKIGPLLSTKDFGIKLGGGISRDFDKIDRVSENDLEAGGEGGKLLIFVFFIVLNYLKISCSKVTIMSHPYMYSHHVNQTTD